MHEFWTILAANMMYTRLQNYKIMVIGEHGIQTFEVVVVVFVWFLSPHKWFVQIYLNVSYKKVIEDITMWQQWWM